MKQQNQVSKKRINTAIMLESVLHLKLSKEQFHALVAPMDTQSMINACAGSGKTTVLMLKNFMAILVDKCRPSDILDITFTRDARKNMHDKFMHIRKILRQKHIYPKHNDDTPRFRTFSSLYLYIVRKSVFSKKFSQNYRVVQKASREYNYLSKFLVYKSRKRSGKSMVRHIFKYRTTLILMSFFTDGLHCLIKSDPNNWQIVPITLDLINQINNLLSSVSSSEDYKPWSKRDFINYVSVMKGYRHYKRKSLKIDYNDMKLYLFYALKNPEQHRRVSKVVSHVKLCFIDEFQDINTFDWHLLKFTLPKRVLNRLVVIGDDDQSIYSFRGADPKAILGFKDRCPHAKVFKLSRNYRTPRNVLNSVRPLIENNKFRMNKKLESVPNSQGHIYQIDNSDTDAGLALLQKLWSMRKNPKIANSSLAVLVRYNIDGSLAADWLANRGVFVKPKTLLQKYSYYNQIMSLISAFVNNNEKQLYHCAVKIDFYAYQMHFKHIGHRAYYRTKPSEHQKMTHHIPVLVQKMCELDKYLPKKRKNDEFTKHDKDVLNASKTLSVRKVTDISGILALNIILDTTKTYYSYMTENHFMNGNSIKKINNYLKHEMKYYGNIHTFFSHEKKKIWAFRQLTRKRNRNELHILTIHQSKGLQFKHVFLYNLTSSFTTPTEQLLNKYFAPHESRMKFFKTLISIPKDDKKDLVKHEDASKSEDSLTDLFDELDNRYQEYKSQSSSKDAVKGKMHLLGKKLVDNQFDNSGYLGDIHLQNEFNDIQVMVDGISRRVEEERRLIYVGITRSSCDVYFNYGNTAEYANPLLDELHIPSQNYLIETNHKQFVPELPQLRKQKLTKIQQKIAKLKNEYKAAKEIS